jgi:hypothetical protein
VIKKFEGYNGFCFLLNKSAKILYCSELKRYFCCEGKHGECFVLMSIEKNFFVMSVPLVKGSKCFLTSLC